MTPRQRECLDFILEFYKVVRYAPSYDEIAEALGLCNRGAAYKLVQRLVSKGYVKRKRGHARALTPIDLDRVVRKIERKRAAAEQFLLVDKRVQDR